MKVGFLETKLAEMETRPTYSKDLQYETILQLYQYAQTHKLDPDIMIPNTLVIKPEGILYVYNESQYRLSAGLVKWDDIENIEGLILLEQNRSSQGYPVRLQVIQLTIKRKKSGILSKRPKSLQLLYLCFDSHKLYRTLIEYKSATSFYSLPPKETPTKKKEEEEEVDEYEVEADDDEDDEVEERDDVESIDD
jgi:hypothetical protein